jgi:hypothetical protein
MQREIPIGLCAGLAAALLMVVQTTDSLFGILLGVFAALPITLVSLGWSYRAGLTAAASAVAVVCVVCSLRLGLTFGVATALPAWALAYLATERNTGAPVKWLPLGAIVLVACVLAAFGFLFTMYATAGSYEAALDQVVKNLTTLLHIYLNQPDNQPLALPDIPDTASFVRSVARFAVPFQTMLFAIFSLCGLWLSARIMLVSGRLSRPWPDIAALRLPGIGLAIVAIAGMALLFLPDLAGVVGQFLLAALFTALFVQGLAVLHFMTRGMAGRTFILGMTYPLCIILGSITMPLVALLGLAEQIFVFRDRSKNTARPLPPHS